MPQDITQSPQWTPLIEENEEEVDIDGQTTPPIHDEYWEAAHPNSPLTTPLTTEPQLPHRTEEITTGSEEQQPLLQSIPEEVPAAAADEIAQDDPDVDVLNASPPCADSIPSADTDTVSTAIAEEVARALAITDPNDSTGSPRPVLDVGKKRKNLQPVPVMPKIGKGLKRPKFDSAKFFEEKNFFIGESPYDSAKLRRLRFWTRT